MGAKSGFVLAGITLESRVFFSSFLAGGGPKRSRFLSPYKILMGPYKILALQILQTRRLPTVTSLIRCEARSRAREQCQQRRSHSSWVHDRARRHAGHRAARSALFSASLIPPRTCTSQTHAWRTTSDANRVRESVSLTQGDQEIKIINHEVRREEPGSYYLVTQTVGPGLRVHSSTKVGSWSFESSICKSTTRTHNWSRTGGPV